jgi:hypothetical protein
VSDIHGRRVEKGEEMPENPEKPPLAENHVALGATAEAPATRAGAAVHAAGTQTPAEHDAIAATGSEAGRPAHTLPASDDGAEA